MAKRPAKTTKPTPPTRPPTSDRVRHIKDLVPDPANRRAHNPRNIGMVVDALQQVGAARSIVIDEDNIVLAGNGVTEAAAQAGITKVRVIDAAGDELIAVRRRGLTVEQKRKLAMYDNRAGELASWNAEQLAADLQNGETLAPWFSEKELEALVPSTKAAPDVANQLVPGTFMVVVTCADETDQVQLLERLVGQGLSCKALVS